MKFTRAAVMVLAISSFALNTASAEPKWSLKNLIPKVEKAEETPRGLYPEQKGPSIWQRMNSGRKAVVAKSKELVPPWLMPKTQDRVRKSGNSFTRSASRIREELRTARRNIMAPWSAPREPEQPQTVTDFLALPKPQ